VVRAKAGLAFGITARAWDRLDQYLALAHTRADPALRAAHTVKQWLNQRGPSYEWSDRARVCAEVVARARALAFEEIPGPRALARLWGAASARWCKLRTAVPAGANAVVPT
jgi:hypothetical protein